MAVTLYITSGSNFSINDLRESIPSCKAIKEYDQLQQALADLVEEWEKEAEFLYYNTVGEIGASNTYKDCAKQLKAIAAAEALGGKK